MELRIACPIAHEEQQSILTRLKEIDVYLFEHLDDLAKLRGQKSGLMHDLLAGKVLVKGGQSVSEAVNG